MTSRSSTNAAGAVHLEPNRLHKSGPILLAGLRRHVNADDRGQIPELWHEVGPLLDKIPEHAGKDSFGVCFVTTPDSRECDYIAAAEVSKAGPLPAGWTHLQIPALSYAVFNHNGHVSEIARTVSDIFRHWVPETNFRLVAHSDKIPDFLEHYGLGYNPATGTGDIAIWVPVEK